MILMMITYYKINIIKAKMQNTVLKFCFEEKIVNLEIGIYSLALYDYSENFNIIFYMKRYFQIQMLFFNYYHDI